METAFLSYSFEPEARELARKVERLMESHELGALTGEVLEGQPLTQAVLDLIGAADATIAVLSPKFTAANGALLPSAWVQQELAFAIARDKPCIAMVDTRVQVAGAMVGYEHIPYDLADLLPAFLKLSETLGAWKRRRGRRVKVRIFPGQLESTLGNFPAGTPECRYRLTRENSGAMVRDWKVANVRLEPGGAFAYLEAVPTDTLLEVQIRLPTESWGSRATPQWLHVELARS